MSETPESLLLAESARMYESEPFKVLREFMFEQVKQAQEECFACIGSLETRGLLQLRWQQREAMYRAMIVQAEDTIKSFKEEQEQFEKDFATLSGE